MRNDLEILLIKKICLSFVLLSISNLSATTKLEVAMGLNGIEEGLSLIERWENEPGSELEIGIVYHNLSLLDPRIEWIKEGIALLDNEYKKNNSPKALAYWGSLMTIKGNYYAINHHYIIALMSLKKGLNKIDKAIAMDSSSFDLRMLRIINGISVTESSPVSRTDVVKTDIEFLEKNTNQLSNDYKSMLYYYKGLLLLSLDEIDECISSLDLAIKASPQSIFGLKALELLASKEE